MQNRQALGIVYIAAPEDGRTPLLRSLTDGILPCFYRDFGGMVGGMPDLATVPLLLVEDNEADALILQKAFRRLLNLSNPIFTVSGSARAIEYLEGKGAYGNRDEFPLPGVVLVAPGMMEVLRLIRETPSLSHLFVVALVSHEAQAHEAGADSYLVRADIESSLAAFVQLLRKHWSALERILEFRQEMASAPLLQR